uniref:Uncharacterized protein n=1 Tax=Gasterosteus aculeatus TaxID=69293 RepID=G3NW16_GASAC
MSQTTTRTHTCVCWHPPGPTWPCTSCTTAKGSTAPSQRLPWWASGCPLSQEVKAGRSEDTGERAPLWKKHLTLSLCGRLVSSHTVPLMTSDACLTVVWPIGGNLDLILLCSSTSVQYEDNPMGPYLKQL